MSASETHRAIDAGLRIESAKLIAGLARIVRDVGIAEDLAQDALVAALDRKEVEIAWNTPLAHGQYHVKNQCASRTLAMRDVDREVRSVLLVGGIVGLSQWSGPLPGLVPEQREGAAGLECGCCPLVAVGAAHPVPRLRREHEIVVVDTPPMIDTDARRAIRAADLVVVGPEAPLIAGAGDALRAAGLSCFGPDRAAAMIEGSKSAAKQTMLAAGIPTAASRTCRTEEEVSAALDKFGPPYVVKADGLAAGKGVVVTTERSAAAAHAAACGHVVIEEFLDGPEVSVFALADGTTAVPPWRRAQSARSRVWASPSAKRCTSAPTRSSMVRSWTIRPSRQRTSSDRARSISARR